MATSFSSLKTSQNIENLTKKIEAENKSYIDERQWKPTVDTNGNGFAIIRFLPPSKEDDSAWVKYYMHAYKNVSSGKWFIENCPTSIGQDCLICSANSKLWNTGVESDKAIVRTRKRQTKYVSNVYIVSDPKNPDNEGKVFLFTYGTKIFEKIKSCLKKEDEYDTSIKFDPFDFWKGANFKLKIKNVAKQRNYDSSSFDTCGPLSTDDSVLEKIWECEYTLKDFLDPKIYLAPDILEKKFRDSISDYSSQTSSAVASPIQEAPSQPTAEIPSSEKYKDFLNKLKDDNDEEEIPF